jgi:hypothetical protein
MSRLSHHSIELRHQCSGGPHMRDIELLVQAYLSAERDLVAAVEAAGGCVPLRDGRTVSVGRAEFDALFGGRQKRAWVTVRKLTQMPPQR